MYIAWLIWNTPLFPDYTTQDENKSIKVKLNNS